MFSSAQAAYTLRTVLAESPLLYFSLYRRLRRRQHGLLGADTALTVDGFPRSGNSFLMEAFWQTNPGVPVAHHTHAAAQVIGSVRRGLPTLVLIREPQAAIASFLVMRPDIGWSLAAWSYVRFYRPLLAYRRGFLLAQFEDVTRDLGQVIISLNRQFGTGFAAFDHREENVAEVFGLMDERARRRFGGQVKAGHIAKPAEDKRQLRERQPVPPHCLWLDRAKALYRQLSSD